MGATLDILIKAELLWILRNIALLFLVSDGHGIYHVFNLDGNSLLRKRPLSSWMLLVSYKINPEHI